MLFYAPSRLTWIGIASAGSSVLPGCMCWQEKPRIRILRPSTCRREVSDAQFLTKVLLIITVVAAAYVHRNSWGLLGDRH